MQLQIGETVVGMRVAGMAQIQPEELLVIRGDELPSTRAKYRSHFAPPCTEMNVDKAKCVPRADGLEAAVASAGVACAT
jgi:hypothetical protein